MNNITESIVTVATAIVGVAILAVLVSRNSNTSGVIASAGKAFSGALGTAVSPVTGGGYVGGGMNFGNMPFGTNALN